MRFHMPKDKEHYRKHDPDGRVKGRMYLPALPRNHLVFFPLPGKKSMLLLRIVK